MAREDKQPVRNTMKKSHVFGSTQVCIAVDFYLMKIIVSVAVKMKNLVNESQWKTNKLTNEKIKPHQLRSKCQVCR